MLPAILLLFLGGTVAHPDRIIFPNPACEDPPAVLLEVQGTLQRPVGRDSRSSPANCTWLILGRKEQTVTVRFQKLHLACGSERLTLRSPVQPQISLCEAPASPLQLPGGNVTITYSYVGARAPMGQGFLLSYSQDWLMCLQEEFQCLNHRCVPLLQRCDGVDACGDGSDEAGCSSDPFPDLALAPVLTPPCNHTLEDFYGVFSSFGYSHLASVSHPQSCRWLLDPRDGRRLAVRFTALDLGYDDAVRVYDGAGPLETLRLLRSLTRFSNGKAVTVETLSGQATVDYRTVPWSTGRGFNATYHVRGYCLPWDRPCGLSSGLGASEGLGERCYSEAQRCDGSWDCADGTDEENSPLRGGSQCDSHRRRPTSSSPTAAAPADSSRDSSPARPGPRLRPKPAPPARPAASRRPPPAGHSAPTMSATGLGPVRCAFVLLLALCSRPASSQDCSAPCQCPAGPAPRCPAGVSLVLDGCGCCRVCAKQLSELCTERDPCDPHKGLFCDFGSPANRKIGVCTAKDGAPCVFGGTVYQSGESFQSSCKYQCTCLDGSVGCVPLCSVDVRLPSPDCPFPRRVKLPGKCCEEWVCDEPKEHTVVGPALAAYRPEDTFGPDPTMIRANCLVQTTEWSACSKTCGMGISTRVTNDNAFCRLEKQSRLCMVRPCEADLEENIKKGKKCIRTPKISKPIKFELSGCTSMKTYRAKFCGVCTDGRCCTPHRTTTLPVEFKCPDGEVMKKSMMFIKTCACHYNCPGDNDIFESLYYRKMYGDMA